MRKKLSYVGVLLAAFCITFATPLVCAAESESPIWSIEFSPDGKTIAVGKYQWVELWDLETQRLIRTYEPHAGEVRGLKFSSQHARGSPHGKPHTVDLDTENQQATSLKLYASGGIAAQSGEIRVWDVDSEELINSFEIHADTIESIALSPSNTTLLTASMDEYSAVIDLTLLTDTTTPIDEHAKWLTQHVGRVLCTLYHPEGAYFVTGSEDKTIKVWHPDTYNVLVNFDANDDAVYSLAYAANEDVIVSGSADNTVRTWRVASTENGGGQDALGMTGALVREYNGHQGAVYSVDCGTVTRRANNRMETVIASGSADTSVIIWNLRSGNRFRTFDESTDAVYAVQLSPDGEFVAAGGRDGKLRLWNLRRRTLTHEF